MKIGELTRDAVLEALAECDRLGTAEFLKTYGFKPAVKYVLVHEGKEYDSKAIAGVAHWYCQGRALTSDEFSGGKAAAAGWLLKLGFDVRTPKRNPDWVWDELVLACALLAENGWAQLDAGDKQVVELSRLLQKLPFHDKATRGDTFRNANGVARKIVDIRTCHPDNIGRLTRTNGNRLDYEVLAAFLAAPARMAAAAARIKAGLRSGELLKLPKAPLEELEEYSAPEGRILARRHLYRERNQSLRERKLAEVLGERGHLGCAVCDFDFEAKYGAHGAGYIECHHVVPLHVAGEGETRLSDLALVCANCHRMVHRTNPWLTIDELRALLAR
ncbi:HNH endonuclease [Embleya sp. NPDC050493]|uniref:HNH endonuclease n=1 Tax=Embleya sp. NPDC050493 TaxID=3363989 RepID=UPI0037A39419